MNLGKAAELLEEAEICLKLLVFKQLLGQVQAETALFEDEFAEEYAKLLRKLESDLARAGTASERERLKSAFVAACVALMAKLQVKRAGNAARAGWRGSEDDPEFDAMMLTLQDTWEASRLEGFEPRLNKAARAEPESLTQKLMAVGSYGMMFGGMVWSAFWKGKADSAPPELPFRWAGTVDAATCADCLNRIGRVYTKKSLPGLPGDQSTACNGRCRCWLEEGWDVLFAGAAYGKVPEIDDAFRESAPIDKPLSREEAEKIRDSIEKAFTDLGFRPYIRNVRVGTAEGLSGAWAHYSWDKDIVLREDLAHAIRMIFRDPAKYLGDEYHSKAFSTLVHEALHGVSQPSKQFYSSFAWLEEGVTETTTRLFARPVAESLWGISPASVGPDAYMAEQSFIRTLAQIANRSGGLTQTEYQDIYFQWAMEYKGITGQQYVRGVANSMASGYFQPLAEIDAARYQQLTKLYEEFFTNTLGYARTSGMDDAGEALLSFLKDADDLMAEEGIPGMRGDISRAMGLTRELMARRQFERILQELHELFLASHEASRADILENLDKANDILSPIDDKSQLLSASFYLEGMNRLLEASSE